MTPGPPTPEEPAGSVTLANLPEVAVPAATFCGYPTYRDKRAGGGKQEAYISKSGFQPSGGDHPHDGERLLTTTRVRQRTRCKGHSQLEIYRKPACPWAVATVGLVTSWTPTLKLVQKLLCSRLFRLSWNTIMRPGSRR